ncbi:recombinase family protein [Streptomyces sp. KL116D]|uniref:recombinase family protein n=1 Tax=Streptomyces sp. KL116D TaxID=3045152 RepID=UPI0035572C8E
MAPVSTPIRLRPAPDADTSASPRRRRGIIYVRVSVARADMISPELQVTHARKLAEANDIDVDIEPIMDLGESGREFEERKIDEIKQMARDRKFDVLILWIWSRFGRNLKESLQHLDDLMAYGIEVRAAREDFDGKTTIGRFAIAQMLNIAELESNQKSDQWKDTIERRKQHGLPHGGATRGKFGYYRCDTCPSPERGKPMDKCPKCKAGILKLDPTYRSIYITLYKDYADGVSVRSMVLWLRAKGLVNWTGRPIDAGDLYSILDSGFALGFVRYTLPEELHTVIVREDGTTKKKRKSTHRDITSYLYYKGKHEAVFNDEVEAERVWDAYVERRLSGRDKDDRNHSHRAKYSVSGVLKCAACGEGMHSMLRARRVQRPWQDGKPDPRDVLFRCTRHMKFKDCPGNGVYVTLETAEAAVRGFLAEQIARDVDGARSLPARITQVHTRAATPEAGEGDESARLDAIEREISDLRRKEDKLTDAVMDELISADAARRRRASYEARTSALHDEMKRIRRKLAEQPAIIPAPEPTAVASAMEVFDVAVPDDQRVILRKLIREIHVHRGRDPRTKTTVYPMWIPAPPSRNRAENDSVRLAA